MADFKNFENCNDAVCIDAGRVYDSCCDRDCLEDLRCFFLPETQTLINNALSVRLRSAEVLLKEDGSFKLIRRAEKPSDYFATFDCTEFTFGE